MRRGLFAAILALGTLILPGAGSAQDYPSRPVRLVVPFPPGGGTDLAGRLTADILSPLLGQSIVIENRGGAGSAIGLDVVAKAKPDGYTLAWATSDGLSMLPAVKSSMPYRVPEDFEFIAVVSRTSGSTIALNAKLPFKSLAELIAYAKANPGKLRYSTQGVGTSGHLVGALMAKVAGIDIVHIPYQGSAPAAIAAAGGFVDFTLVGVASMKSFADSGQLRPIATFEPRRHPLLPDMPTLAEAGLPGVKAGNFYGILAPAGTPEPIRKKIESAVADMLKDEKVIQRYRDIGVEPVFYDGPAYRQLMVEDLAQWRDVAKAANISLGD